MLVATHIGVNNESYEIIVATQYPLLFDSLLVNPTYEDSGIRYEWFVVKGKQE